MRRLRRRQPKKTAAWKRALELGVAGDLCDELVRRHHAETGIPPALADALVRPLSDRDRRLLERLPC